MLAAEGYGVQTASRGRDGVALATAGAFDLILLAADLADMSGLEALSRLRQADVGARLIFVSDIPATATAARSLHLSACP